MINDLSSRQQEILKYITTYTNQHGFPPTIREIGVGIGISKSPVAWHLIRLSDAGYVRRRRRTPRGLKLTDKGARWVKNNEQAEQAINQKLS